MSARTKSKSSKSVKSESIKSKSSDKSSVVLELPFTLDEKLFFAVTSFIAIYEIAFWLIFDYPFTLHSRQKTPVWILGISASLNSIPHLFCGTYGLLYITRSYKSAAILLITKYKHKKQLKKINIEKEKQELIKKHENEIQSLPVYQKGGLRFSIYLLYVSLFTLMQTYFWWLPYFFGIVTSPRFQTMQNKLNGVISILPSNKDYLVPSAEHTILFPLSIISWILSIKLFIKYRAVIITQVRTKWANYSLLASFSALICYLPTSMANMVIKKNNSKSTENIENDNNVETEKDRGAAMIAALIIFINITFYIALFWSPNYKKAKAAQKLKEKKTK